MPWANLRERERYHYDLFCQDAIWRKISSLNNKNKDVSLNLNVKIKKYFLDILCILLCSYKYKKRLETSIRIVIIYNCRMLYDIIALCTQVDHANLNFFLSRIEFFRVVYCIWNSWVLLLLQWKRLLFVSFPCVLSFCITFSQ